jgi:serine phosphatase RsbU (regulator of sigma subunit)
MVTWVVLSLSLIVTGVLAFGTSTVNDRNENRLLSVQVREAGTVLAAAIPIVETPLAASAAIAGLGPGQATRFDALMGSFIGAGRPFAFAELCGIEQGAPVVLASLGTPSPETSVRPGVACAFVSNPKVAPGISVRGILAGDRALGYAYRSGFAPVGVYAETLLTPHRHVSLPKSLSLSNLNFALYLGRHQENASLLETSASRLPITGRQASATVPFADTTLTLVASPTQPLGGTLSRELTTIVGVLGAALAVGAALMTEWLVRRRKSAEALAEENQRLYREQHGVALELQRALLPKDVPVLDGIQMASRYEAGLEAMDVGGDWFDLIYRPRRDDLLFVVGDVSGRGVHAAIIMASLHYAIRAYAAEGDSPSIILAKLGALLDVERDGHFATVLCGSVDMVRREVTLASAGHFPPLVVSEQKGSFVEMVIGPPIGATARATYGEVTMPIPPECTILAFTDGLIEQRGQNLDEGLTRLLDVAIRGESPLDELIATIVSELTPQGSDDDLAILGLRWNE